MEAHVQTTSRPRRRRWGDRYDGRLLRSLNPFYRITPYIMRSRSDAQVYFEDTLDIGRVEKWLRQKRDEGRTDLGFLHVLVTALVRTISQKPALNRFIAGQRLYARNEIQISLALKKKLQEEGEETTIKLTFLPTDTIWEVADRINKAVEENKKVDERNSTDATARLFMLVPGFLVRFIFWLVRFLDYRGKLPKVLHRASPFHTSIFVTDLGSLGMKSIYHHLYDLGTTSIFVAFGVKQTVREIDHEGKRVHRRHIGLKVVGDERICDGHYFATSFRVFGTLFRDPTQLESPPERVVEDVD
jgi:hypothetical protein